MESVPVVRGSSARAWLQGGCVAAAFLLSSVSAAFAPFDPAPFNTVSSPGIAGACGDGIVDSSGGERCDAGGEDRFCNANCQVSVCGDGVVNAAAGEACEPGLMPGTCGSNCQPAMCGDGIVNGDEECDDGPANSDTEPGACRTDCSVPACGDGIIDPGEDVDPPVGLSIAVPVDPQSCRHDFTGVTQLYCQGTCGNPWGGGDGCQEDDANKFCKLLTGNPLSELKPDHGAHVTTAKPEPGICCPSPTLANPETVGCAVIGNMDSRGVDVVVSVHESLSDSLHGGSAVRVTLEDCTNPGVED